MPGVVFDPGYWGYHPALTGLIVKVNKCILKSMPGVVLTLATGVTWHCPGEYIKVIKCILQFMPGVVFDPGYWGYPALPGSVH
jgi:hypothetical protein